MRRALLTFTAVAGAATASCWLVKSDGGLDGPPSAPDAASDGDDAGPIDASGGGCSDAIMPTGCCIGDILCDDFEHGIAPFWTSDSVPIQTSTTTIDSTKAFHGKNSMHAHVDPPGDGSPQGAPQAFISADQGTTHPLNPNFFVRFFLYVASGGLAAMDTENDGLVVMFEPNNFAVELRLAGQPGAKVLGLANYVDGLSNISATPFPFDSWHCVEWNVDPKGMAVWLDGT